MNRVTAVVLWLALVALAAVVRLSTIPGDEALFQALAGHGNLALGLVSRVATVPVWSALVLVAAGVLWWRGRGWVARWLVLSEVGAEVAALVVKAMVARPRPAGAVLEDVVPTASFPSSHAVRATAALGFLLVALVWRAPAARVWRVPALLVAVAYLLALGIARVASGEHWPSDVVGGYLLGAAWVATVTALPWFRTRESTLLP